VVEPSTNQKRACAESLHKVKCTDILKVGMLISHSASLSLAPTRVTPGVEVEAVNELFGDAIDDL